MSMVVMHNIPALSAYNTVNATNSSLEKSIKKLSTGLRINSAADDAAGLAISEKMRAQINGLDRAASNAQDGISMIQTAEGALNETHSILQRMRELSVQAANDTLTQQDRGYIQEEINQLREEVTRIGNTTQFNKKKLLNGDAAVLWSSNNLKTKATVNGGLRTIDQFGQKNAAEGNYQISIRATPGQAQVQKSDIFKIKHENVLYNVSTNVAAGVSDVKVSNVPAANWTVDGVDPANTTQATMAALTGNYGVGGTTYTTTATNTVTIAQPGGTVDEADSAFTMTVLGETIEVAARTGGYAATAAGQTAARQSVIDAVNGHTFRGGVSVRAAAGGAAGQITFTITSGSPLTTAADGSIAAGGIISIAANTATTGIGNAADVESGQVAAANVNVATTINDAGDAFTLTPADTMNTNANILFEVMNVDRAGGSATLKATALKMDANGNRSTQTMNNISVSQGGGAADLSAGLGVGAANSLTIALNGGAVNALSVGDKFVYNVGKAEDATTGGTADVQVSISGAQNSSWPDRWGADGASVTRNPVIYGLTANAVDGNDVTFSNFYLNEKTGEAVQGDITLTLNSNFADPDNVNGNRLATFSSAYVGQVAQGDVALRDIDKFWDNQGVFMLTDPKTLTITQGDGSQTNVTLYANDTLNDVATKINNAIATGLGQAQYVTDPTHFADFIETVSGETSESVAGTMLIRSVRPGANGTISFSGDENVLNALSLNEIQGTRESNYEVTIYDAHTGAAVVDTTTVTGNKLIGLVHENVDVTFDDMLGVSARWDDARKAYVFNQVTNASTTTLHLADNTTVFQIGANEGEDMGINIGDMRSTALGLDSVLVTDRESAARSITIIDNAIDKVSTQRARLGAYQNRLEHTITNLNTASENLTAAESRIRDTDMAKEMMNFVKLQILYQAGTSMLAQANQLPQTVLSLIS